MTENTQIRLGCRQDMPLLHVMHAAAHTAVTNMLHTVQTDLLLVCNHGLSFLDKPIPRPFCIISQAPSFGLVLLLHFDQLPVAGEVGQAGSPEVLYALEVMLTHELLEQGRQLMREKSGEDKTRPFSIEGDKKPQGGVHWASLWAVAHASSLAFESVLKQLVQDKQQQSEV